MIHIEGPGKLIVFEGIDGCGKTTQLQLLADILTDQGFPVVSTKEPTEGPFGQKIRKLYQNRESVSRRQELELFIDDRREHVRELLKPSIAAGKIVLCDRYVLSTVAYQGAAGMNMEEIFLLNNFAPGPDLALLFQTEPDTSIARITGNRRESLNDFEQAEGLAKVAKIFGTLDLPYIRRIDATGSIASVHQAVMMAVEPLLEQYKSR
jgi:dTMP kinase